MVYVEKSVIDQKSYLAQVNKLTLSITSITFFFNNLKEC